MEHECPQNIPTQKSRCATEPDFTHMSEKGTSEIPESFTESPNTHFSPRLGITMNERAEECVNHFAFKLYIFFFHACSLHPAGKSTDESPSSSAGDTHSSCTDVPLCITDVYSSHAVEVMYVFFIHYIICIDKIQTIKSTTQYSNNENSKLDFYYNS